MIIEQAFEIILDFFTANQVTDTLTGMEIMIANYKQLNKQEGLVTFMAASHGKTVVNQ